MKDQERSILFSLRAYNDIDHISPIIWALLKYCENIRVYVLISNHDTDFLNDYRIQFLKDNGAHVHHILDFSWLGVEGRHKLFKFKLLLSSKKTKLFLPIRFILNRFTQRVLKNIDLSRVFNLVTDNLVRPTVFAHDYGPNGKINDWFVEKVREYGGQSVALPHGTANWDNLMTTTQALIPKASAIYKGKYIADWVVATSEYQKDFMIKCGEVRLKQMIVLGSARFCKEWTNILDKILPAQHIPYKSKSTFKILLLMKKASKNIFEQEIFRIIKMLSKMDGMEIIVKPHTRGSSLPKDIRDNVLVADDIDTRHLVEHADVVLFNSTTVIMDCLIKKIPVIFLRRTLFNKVVFERFFSTWAVDCRDDLCNLLLELKSGKLKSTYTEKERAQCVRELAEPRGKNVLKFYTDFFQELLSNQSDYHKKAS